MIREGQEQKKRSDEQGKGEIKRLDTNQLMAILNTKMETGVRSIIRDI